MEAWRQLNLRYDPVGETYEFDQMLRLMEVSRCTHMADLPPAIS